jgi:bifunctional non-homologous end joining protein LigD
VTEPLDDLQVYSAKRDFARTPEPRGKPHSRRTTGLPRFVVQEHHASSLHWDFRLERDGVGPSWAVPKGIPLEPKTNHLAVRVEDHPLDYFSFEGRIGEGQYGGGEVTIWDSGTYEPEEWEDAKVKVVLHGERLQGRYVLFQTHGKNWMIHRMDAPTQPGFAPVPQLIRPMLAVTGPLPEGTSWSYEMKWDGLRAIVYVDGGRARVLTRNDREVLAQYPELRAMAESMGSTQAVLDGEIVAFDDEGRPSFGRLQQRMHVTKASALDRLRGEVPIHYVIFDLLHLDGRSVLDQPLSERRRLLDSLGLAGDCWSTPGAFTDVSGQDILAASLAQGLEGVVAKRVDSPYLPGRRSDYWTKVKNFRTQEVVIGGWRPGEGRRSGTIGSLLMGVGDDDGNLVYAGKVGTGFTDRTLDELHGTLAKLERKTSPFATEVPRPDSKDAHWVTPTLVAEVRFGEWTGDGRLRHPSYRGLRPDKSAAEVRREDDQ